MKVVGTAGHVDHGKSTLVNALTGINPDRLKEEQKREMTIDLGFAWMTLADGEQVGIVDVPGHRDFIDNMLAGVGGIDTVIFVIAADEGIMPQTREHLAILNVLHIHGGVIALTKSDLVDAEWLEMMQEEVQDFIKGTILEKAPIIPVSAKTGAGVDQLKLELGKILAAIPPRQVDGHPRLPIDRVFTIAGFGTVVTGTLLDGSLKTGSEIEILPSGVKGRIRGLQSQKQKEEIIYAGSRCAVNISGVDVAQIRRGDVLALPGYYKPTSRFDAKLELLKDEQNSLQHADEVKLFTGTTETIAKVRLLGMDELKPGEQGWAQLDTADPVIVRRGDRFVIRQPSPAMTLGGGSVVEPHPNQRYKRFDERIVQRLKQLQEGSISDLILQTLNSYGLLTIKAIAEKIGRSIDQVDPIVKQMRTENLIINLEESSSKNEASGLLTSKYYWDEKQTELLNLLSVFHQTNPLKKGLPLEEIKGRLKLDAKAFAILIGDALRNQKIVQSGALIAKSDHRIEFDPEQKKKVDLLLKAFAQSPLSPPSPKDSIGMIGEDLYYALQNTGDLIQVSDDVVFSNQGFELLTHALVDFLQRNNQITVAEFRDMTGTSRKYSLAFLEYCDQRGLTIREGDHRKLKKKNS